MVTSRLNPYLGFDGNAREAIEFYQDVFGGELQLNTFGELGAAHTPDDENKVMHSWLQTPSGYSIMASDAPPDWKHEPGNNITISLSGDDGDELRGYWAKLSESGSVSVPLEKQVWGDEFGMCVDKFGIAWMVNIGQTAD